jgi:hypothetical protein
MTTTSTPSRGARHRRWPLLACALLVADLGRAQEPVTPVADTDRYDVEIIVFRHLDADSGMAAARPALTGSSDTTSTDAPASQASWTPLGPSELRLAGTASRLRRPGGYELLYHGGWSQAVTGRSRAASVPMPPEARANGVAGTVTVYRERYLHAVLDLGLVADSDGAVTAHLRAGRRLKGQALQYFDDPRLGVILSVRPAPAGAAAASNP